MDWAALERAGRLVAGSGTARDGVAVARLRKRVLDLVARARDEISQQAELPTSPEAELLCVDRKTWVSGNVRTLRRLFDDVAISEAEGRVLVVEGGALMGVLARAVLAQFDPFRDQLLVVHPNLGDMAEGDGLRWLVLHEVTHLAQFRAAPWIPEQIVELGRSVLTAPGLGKAMAARARERLPDIVRWARETLDGGSPEMPFLELLPPEHRGTVEKLHGLVTVLEGHATHVTDLIGRRVLDDYAGLQRRIEARRRRSPFARLLEGLMGLEMKRQQYVVGQAFCRTVWEHGGAAAIAPAWRGISNVPTPEELRAPERWLERVGSAADRRSTSPHADP